MPEFEDGELTPYLDSKARHENRLSLSGLEALDRLSIEHIKELLDLLHIAAWQKQCGDEWLNDVHFDCLCHVCGGVGGLMLALDDRIKQDLNNRMSAASDLAIIDMHVPGLIPLESGTSDFGFVNKFDASGRSLSGGDIA